MRKERDGEGRRVRKERGGEEGEKGKRKGGRVRKERGGEGGEEGEKGKKTETGSTK